MPIILDEPWFDRYHAIKSAIGEAYELLEPLPATLKLRRIEFEDSARTENVSLLSDRVDIEKYKVQMAELSRLKTDIENTEKNGMVKETYIAAIRDLNATANLIIASSADDKKLYDASNETLYGAPDAHVFNAACHWIRTDAENALKSDNEILRQHALKVLQTIPNNHDSHQTLIPSEEVFSKVRLSHQKKNGYYDVLFAGEEIPKIPYITQAEGDDLCRKILENIGADWTVVPSENNVWAVMRSRKELVRPDGYRLDRDEFIGIVSHEIGSHVLEEINGSKKSLRLLGVGLSGFEKGNEGRAFLREQIVYDSERTFLNQFAWEYIVLLHLSVSLSAGLDGNPYGFAKLYQTIHTLYSFWREKRMPYATNNQLFADDEAWYLCVRIMKGTDGSGRGYMKDAVYLEGNVKCWQLAEVDPDVILFGDHGMFDITNERHRQIVRQLEDIRNES